LRSTHPPIRHVPDEDSKEEKLPKYKGGGLISLGFIKKTTSYGIEKFYLLYIFPPELHTLMTSLF
jgi:hypothetical protein